MDQGTETGAESVRLVVVGSIGLDTIITPLERREEILGGSVSYACAGASFFVPVGCACIASSVSTCRGCNASRGGLSAGRASMPRT